MGLMGPMGLMGQPNGATSHLLSVAPSTLLVDTRCDRPTSPRRLDSARLRPAGWERTSLRKALRLEKDGFGILAFYRQVHRACAGWPGAMNYVCRYCGHLTGC